MLLDLCSHNRASAHASGEAIAQQQYGMLPDMESAVSTRDTLVRRTLLAASPIDGAAVARAAGAGADAVVLDLARGPAAHRRDEARGVLGDRVATLTQSGGETLLWTDAASVGEDLAACPPGAITGVLVTAGSHGKNSTLWTARWANGNRATRMQRGVVNVEVVLATAAAVQMLCHHRGGELACGGPRVGRAGVATRCRGERRREARPCHVLPGGSRRGCKSAWRTGAWGRRTGGGRARSGICRGGSTHGSARGALF